MELSDGLRVILKGHLGWGKCRLDCFAGMLLALVRLKRMNLTQLALAFTSQADQKSLYRRLQRFLREVVFDYDAVARLIMQQWVWLSGMKLSSGELLILAGNRRFSQPLEVYGRRWEIEHLFQCLKGRGFHLEETRLTRYFRIKKVMALLALAFCWAHKTGEWKHQAVRPLKSKKHGRPEQSLFRYGLDYLTHSLLQGLQKMEERFRLLLLFLCPPAMITVSGQNPDIMALKI